MKILGFNISRSSEAKASDTWRAIMAPYGSRAAIYTPKDYGALSKAGYQLCSTSYACISLIARTASGIKWTVSQKQSDGTLVELDKHPLLDLLARPNEYESGFRLIEAIISYKLLSGNAYIEKVHGLKSAPPRFLYALRPDRITIKPGDARGLVRFYTYKANGADVLLDLENILHIKDFHPLNDFYGMSRVEVAATSIDISNASQEWNLKHLQNDMHLSGVLTLKGMSAEQSQQIRQMFLDKYQGSQNAGKVAVLENIDESDFKQLSMTPRDADWGESDKRNMRRICAVFNVWSGLLGDNENTTYSNMQEGRMALYQDAVLPEMDGLCDGLNRWLAPQYGDNVVLGYDRDSIEALQEDRGQKYAYIASADWLTVNEKREATGYDDLGAEGDVVLTSFSRIPLDQISRTVYIQPDLVDGTDKPDASQGAQDGAGGAFGAGADGSAGDEPKARKSHPTHESAPAASARKSFWAEPERKSLLWKAFDRRLAMQERQFAPLVRKYLVGQADRIKAKVADGAGSPRAVFDVDAETQAYVKQFYPFYERAFRYAGQAGFRATQGKLWDPEDTEKSDEPGFVVNPEKLNRLREQIEKSAHLFNETTWAEVSKQLEAAMASNLTTEQMAQQLWQSLGERAAWESRRIASTEMTRTDGWGAHEGYKQNSEIDAQAWNCQMLETSRDAHMEIDGQEVGIDENFDVDGWEFRGPADPVSDAAPAGLIVNCRCSTMPILRGL